MTLSGILRAGLGHGRASVRAEPASPLGDPEWPSFSRHGLRRDRRHPHGLPCGERADVTVVITNETIYAAGADGGLKLVGKGAPRHVPLSSSFRVSFGVPNGADAQKFDDVLLATQSPQVEEAAQMAAPLLTEHGAMVCLQNGLCEDRVAKIVGADRVFKE